MITSARSAAGVAATGHAGARAIERAGATEIAAAKKKRAAPLIADRALCRNRFFRDRSFARIVI
jgi:hypothetical protein